MLVLLGSLLLLAALRGFQQRSEHLRQELAWRELQMAARQALERPAPLDPGFGDDMRRLADLAAGLTGALDSGERDDVLLKGVLDVRKRALALADQRERFAQLRRLMEVTPLKSPLDTEAGRLLRALRSEDSTPGSLFRRVRALLKALPQQPPTPVDMSVSAPPAASASAPAPESAQKEMPLAAAGADPAIRLTMSLDSRPGTCASPLPSSICGPGPLLQAGATGSSESQVAQALRLIDDFQDQRNGLLETLAAGEQVLRNRSKEATERRNGLSIVVGCLLLLAAALRCWRSTSPMQDTMPELTIAHEPAPARLPDPPEVESRPEHANSLPVLTEVVLTAPPAPELPWREWRGHLADISADCQRLHAELQHLVDNGSEPAAGGIPFGPLVDLLEDARARTLNQALAAIAADAPEATVSSFEQVDALLQRAARALAEAEVMRQDEGRRSDPAALVSRRTLVRLHSDLVALVERVAALREDLRPQALAA